ncbi:hypothetical protein SAMN05421636_10288 [Pricia antarctica]|uniref:Beta-lactamase-inhibitor-like, PepSY-like n=1 Tax=Pricia antarctica TaxID=641691 RepID=A0A1G6Y2A6_9FLAO|nr:hypothetical protein [Pricia antarctica]SDD84470.1 hypothetical protein SAMN05421636_10288 [Pricia antarctica]
MANKTIFFALLLVLGGCWAHAQNKDEREHRIKKSQFPEKALSYIDEKLEGARRIRFYRETDGTKTSYEAKFKKDRLKYSVEFSEDGVLEDIEFLIGAIDIPDDTFSKMKEYLEKDFLKYRIRRIQKRYPIGKNDTETIVKHAFQNLMLPYIKYEIIVFGKKERGFARYEILFDADGNFENFRKSLPPNYDHILY